MRSLDVGFHPDSPTRAKIDLNGTWSYSLDGSDWAEVKVPSSFDLVGNLTLRRTFEVVADMFTEHAFKVVALGVNYDAEFYINGVFVGRHVGGYTSFEFDIPDNALLVGKENVVTVAVHNRLDARSTIPPRKQIWGWRNYGGILRDMYILATPRTWVESVHARTTLSPDMRQGLLHVTATIGNRWVLQSPDEARGTAPTQQFLFQVELYDRTNDALVARSAPVPITLYQNRGTEAHLTVPVTAPKLWSPETPDIYRARVMVLEQTAARTIVDEVGRNVGFTNVRLEGEKIVLNGKPVVLKGIVWHEDSPDYGASLTYEQMERDVALMKSSGANAVRFAFHPPHPYMLNLCTRYGLFALLEIPAWNVPAAVLAEEVFQVLAEGMMREMVTRDRHQPSVLAWGVGTEFDSADPRARAYVVRVKNAARSLDDRPVYFGSRMIANDMATDLVDVAALIPPPMGVKEFREAIERWKSAHPSKPVLVLRYMREVDHTNHNGYSDPMSQQAQARTLEQYTRAIRDARIAGSFVASLADWRGDRPVLSVRLDDPFLHPVGLTSYAREKRESLNVIRALYNEEKLTALPIGTYRPGFTAAPVVAGLIIIVIVAYFYHYNRRFSDCVNRALLRPYNFFADLRDLHAVSIVHSFVLAIAIACTLAVLTASFLYHLRTNPDVDYFLTQLLVSDWLKHHLIMAAWNLLYGIVLFTGVFLAAVGMAIVVVKLFSFFVKSRIQWYHASSIVVWGALPFVALIVPGMIFLKLFENPAFIWPSVAGVALMFVWVLFRILKGISVIFDISPRRAYSVGLAFCVATAALWLFYYDSAYAFTAYLNLLMNMVQGSG